MIHRINSDYNSVYFPVYSLDDSGFESQQRKEVIFLLEKVHSTHPASRSAATGGYFPG
jgi:hypothetical protein